MKKNHPAGSQPEDNVQPEDPILEVPEITEAEQSAEASQAQADSDGSEFSAEYTALKDQLEAKEKELKETSEKYLRIAAEYDNFRRRSQKEKESLYTDSLIQVVKEWLPVVDNLDRALESVEKLQSEDPDGIGEGIVMIRKQAYDVLEKLGVSEIESLNQVFDPNLHEAVMHVEDDTVGNSTIVEVFQKGYQRGDKVIRHSIVKAANC
jgi:molecular chaperone GrpE